MGKHHCRRDEETCIERRQLQKLNWQTCKHANMKEALTKLLILSFVMYDSPSIYSFVSQSIYAVSLFSVLPLGRISTEVLSWLSLIYISLSLICNEHSAPPGLVEPCVLPNTTMRTILWLSERISLDTGAFSPLPRHNIRRGLFNNEPNTTKMVLQLPVPVPVPVPVLVSVNTITSSNWVLPMALLPRREHCGLNNNQPNTAGTVLDVVTSSE